MKLKIFYSLLLLGFITACEQKEIEFPATSQIIALASPVQLNTSQTEVNLEDYFTNTALIDSVSIPEGLKGIFSADKKVIALTKQSDELPFFSVIRVWSEGFPYSILVKKSKKINYTLTFNPGDKTYKDVRLKGEMNNWNPQASHFELIDGIWSTNLELFPGKYQYLFVVDGSEIRDPNNPDTIDNNMGGFNSLLTVGENVSDRTPFLNTKKYSDKTVTIAIQNTAGNVIVFWQNYRIEDDEVIFTEDELTFEIPDEAEKMKRSWIRIWAENESGTSNDLLIPLNKGQVVNSAGELTREDWEATVFYFLMIDRFNNGSEDNDFPVKDPQILPKVNYYGGDIAGVTQKIKDGYFENLGINTIWLSPISQNPLDAYGYWPKPETKFSGYHGYWPVSSSKVDFRYGTETQLNELLAIAHEHNINIILDYVAHHVHELHPAYKLHPEWATDLYLPDGSMNTERWDEYRLTTWFDKFLPTLDLSKPEIVNVMSDSALFWMTHYDIDGFRHDATKHIPELFWRVLTKKLKYSVAVEKNKRIYQVGETYGSRELIASYVNSGMMDAQFDFAVYDQAAAVFARDNESFEKLAGSFQQSLDYYGYHNLMGYITGNQDKPRFISLAGGDLKFNEDSKMAGWTREIGVGDPTGYKKLQCFTAFNMTIPGIPTIYYGEEFGMPGANDPDNRRMMKFDQLSQDELNTKEITEKLVHLRRDKLSLTFGDYKLLLADQSSYVFSRTYFDKIAVVFFNKSSEPKEIAVNLPERFTETELVPNFNSALKKEGKKVTVTVAPNSFEVLTN
jgi:glycosidase